MVKVQDLVEAEEEVMRMVGHLVWSIEDICHAALMTEFAEPWQKQQQAAMLHATNPQEDGEDSDTNELLKHYYAQTILKVSEFTETILYSILFYKWSESQSGYVSTSPTKWKESLPDNLRRMTRTKANRIVGALMAITRLRLEALDHIYYCLHRAEHLTYEYVQRKSDGILSPYISVDEQQTELERLEDDAIKYVNRQMLTQLKIQQAHANQKLCNTMTDLINKSLENLEYCQRLYRWATSAVQISNNFPTEIVKGSDETSRTESAVEESSTTMHSEEDTTEPFDQDCSSCDRARPVSVVYVQDDNVSTQISI